MASETETASTYSSLEQFPEWFIQWHCSDKFNDDEFFGNNYSYHGTLYSIYTQSEALQYLLLVWLILIIMSLVFGIATRYFLKRKDLQG